MRLPFCAFHCIIADGELVHVCSYVGFLFLGLTDHCLIEVGDNDDAEVDIAWTAYVSRFQTELDLGGILVEIIRALWQLRYSDRELAVDTVVGGVFEIDLSGSEQEAQQSIVFAWFQYRFQIEGVFPVGFPSMDEGEIICVLLVL